MPVSIIVISFIFMLIGSAVQARLKSRFSAYAKVPTSSGLSGREIAEKMLHDNGIFDVKVISVNGFLTDHYNPANKTVNLSPDVYAGTNVSAAAVAAHECGHAVQHAKAYSMLQLRSALVPAASLSTKLSQWVIMAGLVLMFAANFGSAVLLIGIILFAVSTLFTVVTLPVEFDASNRALKWLDSSHLMMPEEHAKAKDALKWAALTYVVAALASIAMLLEYIMIYNNRR